MGPVSLLFSAARLCLANVRLFAFNLPGEIKAGRGGGRLERMAVLPGLLLLCLAATARGHGGMIWPPVWQDGSNNTIAWLDLVNSTKIASNPIVVDPKTGKPVSEAKQFLTDQIYLGGHGPQYQTEGKKDMPWKAPGFAMNFGGGCGVFGGNPYGCPAHLDTRVSDPTKGRKNDIKCGQPSMGYNRRGTFAFGSDARELEFPQMRTTEWARYEQCNSLP